MLIKNATRLKNVHDGFRRKKKERGERERGEERGRRRKTTLSNLFSVCVAAREAVSKPTVCVKLQATAGKMKAVRSEQHNKYLLQMQSCF